MREPYRLRAVGLCVQPGPDMDISLEIHCDQCGSANLAFGDGGDDTLIHCNDCGIEHGSVAALKAELVEHLLAQSAEVLRRGIGPLAAAD